MMKDINNYIVKNKKIILRADLNVPVLNGVISEQSRIEAVRPTIKKLIKNKNKIFILSHFGRPQGIRDKKFSLKFICSALQKVLQINKIYFLENLEHKDIKTTIEKMNPGEVCLFENIRFYSEEENNDINFAKMLSKNFDVYINDAFSASHRKHSSIVNIPKMLTSYAGTSLIKEIENINFFIKNPKKPNLAIIGGSKISTKISLLNQLVEICDTIFIGGAMANTFLKAKRIDIGKSLYENDFIKKAHSIINKAREIDCKIILPIDVVCADNLNKKSSIRLCDVRDVLHNQMILDIGEKTVKKISKHIFKSNMILWNGPLGAFEYKPFEKSSIQIANIIKEHTNTNKIQSIAGGGDTLSLIKKAKARNGFTYISNAGGAFLEWLEGKESPGIIALKEN